MLDPKQLLGGGVNMAEDIKCFRVFIASPGGLDEERKAFREVIDEYNHVDALDRGLLFRPMGWEETLGGVGRPQSLINEEVRKSDYFVLLLWDRWGTPPDSDESGFSSGTEEEFRVALECLTSPDRPMCKMLVLFKAVDSHQLADPGRQLQQVLSFRKQIEKDKSHLFESFDTIERLKERLRRHLAAWVREQEGGRGYTGEQVALALSYMDVGEAVPESEPDTPALRRAWKLANDGQLTDAEVVFAEEAVRDPTPRTLSNYGQFLVRMGRLEQAEAAFRAALDGAQDSDDRDLAAGIGQLAILTGLRGDLANAERLTRRALEVSARLGDDAGLAAHWGNLGWILQTRGDLTGAEECYLKALELNDRLGRLSGTARQLGNLGVVKAILGDQFAAEEYYRKALAIDRELGSLEGVAAHYGNLGNVYKARGDLSQAEDYYLKSLEIDEKLGAVADMARGYLNLGSIRFQQEDFDDAERLYLRSMEIGERFNLQECQADSYGNLANVKVTKKELVEAESYYLKSLAIDERLGRIVPLSNTLGNLSKLYQANNNIALAEEYARKALLLSEKIGNPENIARARSALAELLTIIAERQDEFR